MSKLILKAIPANATSAAADKTVGNIDTAGSTQRLTVQAQPKTQYRLVDAKTGEVVKNQTVVRQGKQLKVIVDGVNAVELDNFFPEEAVNAAAPADSASYLVDTGAAGAPSYGVVSAQTPVEVSANGVSTLWTPGMPALPLVEPVAFGAPALAAVSASSAGGLAAGLGLAAAAAGGGGGGGGGSSSSTSSASIKGSAFKAEVADNTGLVVEAFDSTGKSRGKADVQKDGTYSLTLDDPAYKGSLVLKMYDGKPDDGITPKFYDEATGETKEFTKPLYAVVNYGGDGKAITVNVTPLTNLAATVAGVDTASNKMSVPEGKTADQVVKEANAKVAQKFGLNEADLTAADVQTTKSDKANAYGVALAVISKMEQSKTQDEVAKQFKDDSNGAFTTSLNEAVKALKNDAGTNNDYLKNIDTSKLQAVSDVASDTTAPGLDSGLEIKANTNIDGTKVYLHFDSELSKNTAGVDAFTVSVKTKAIAGDGADTITTPAISSVAIDGNDVVLTLGTAIKKDQEVTITYTKPSDTFLAVQDVAGNDAGSISDPITVKNYAEATKNVFTFGGKLSFDYEENQVVAKSGTYPEVATVSMAEGSDKPTKFRFADSQASISKDGWYSIDKDGNISLTNVGLSAGKASNDFETKINGGNALVYGVQAGDNAGNWSDSVKITLNVTNVTPEAPTVSAPVSFTVTEDVAGNLVFAKDAFADVDSTNLTVKLSTTDGAIKAKSQDGITVAGDGSNSLTLTGTTDALNAFVLTAGNITYQGATDVNGSRLLTIKVSDDSNPALSKTITSNIKITAVNDAPVASSTATLAAINEDNTSASGSTVSDLFKNSFSDSKDTVTNGSSANTLAGVAITTNSAAATEGVWQWQAKDSTTWTAVGTDVSDAKALYLAADSKLRFVPAKDYNGAPGALAARLVDSSASGLNNGSTTDVSSSGGTTAYSASTVSLGTSINAVNDAPVRTAGIDITLNINEDSASTATALGLSAYNYSAGGGADETSGNSAQTLSYKFTNIPSSITLWNGQTQVTTSTTGLTLADMQGLTYKTVADANDSAAQNLTWTVTDSGTGTNSITETISVKVNAMNDAPVNTVPANAVNVEANMATFNLAGTQVAYTPKAITGLSIADVDAGTSTMSVTLSVTNGSLAHSTYSNVTFTKLSDSSFKASGSKTDLNTWLYTTGGVTYTPTQGFKGNDTLTMLTDDGGNSGSGNAKSDSDNVTLTVADKTAPTLLKAETAEADGKVIYLTYNEALDSTNIPAKDAFVFSVKNGDADVTVSVASVSVNGRVVTLTLDKALEVQHVVKLTYTDPAGETAATVQDTVGNDAASLTDQVITVKVPDVVQPVVTDGQSFDYKENSVSNDVVATVKATDNVKVTDYRFANADGKGGTTTSADGYFSIDANGQITLTADGAASGSASNDFETTPNSFTYAIQAGDDHGNWSDAKSVTLNVKNVNEAPTLTSISTFTDFTEDTYKEISYQNLLDAADESDVDAGDTAKFLITGVTTGTLQKWVSGAWADVVAGTTTLGTGEKLQWKAGSDANGSGLNAFSVKAQDAGGLTSDTPVQVKVDVTAVNDAPTVVSSKEAVTLPAITEEASTIAGATVSSLFSDSFSDAKDAVTGGSSANTFSGIAITGNAATATQGTWQWSADGSTNWTDIPNNTAGADAPTNTHVYYLRADASLRFAPATDFNGTPGALTTHLVESSWPDIDKAVNAQRVDSPDAQYYTATAVTLSTSVTQVNDSPTLVAGKEAVTLTAVDEDTANPSGATVSSLFAASFSDAKDAVSAAVSGGSSANTLAGVAIKGNAAAATEGVWQWQANGGNTWTAISTSGLADGTALFLASDTKLRFVPANNYNGTPGSLTARLVDSSAAPSNGTSIDVSNNGGTTAYSANPVSLGTSINALNDAPTVNAPGTFTVSEETAGNLQYTGTPFADIDSTNLTVTLSITDGSINAITGGNVTVAGTATARTFAGTAAALNTYFTTAGNITYTGAQDVNGTRTLTTSVSDGYLTNVNPSTTTININAVNDAPTITTPAGTPSGANSNVAYSIAGGFTIADVDAGSSTVQVNFQVLEGAAIDGDVLDYGTLPAVVTLVGGTYGSNHVYSFQGTISALNAWMLNTGFLKFTSTSASDVTASIKTSVSDLGNTGTGGALTANGTTLNVNVVSDSTPPALIANGATTDNYGNIVLTYDDTLSANGPSASMFSVFMNGSVAANNTVNNVTVSGRTVTLDLATKIRFGDTVQVSYTDGAGNDVNAIQDSVGNDAVSLAKQTVTNSVPNVAPTLTSFAAAVATGNEDTAITVTVDNLKTQGNEADTDGTVTAFVVKIVNSGSLKIGISSAAATAWVAGTNDVIDATRIAYWTPVSNANGATLDAFSVVAKDNGGAVSTTNVSAKVAVNSVNDAPVASGTASLASILEDNTSSTGSLVSALFGTNANFSDVDGNTLGGVAITANAATAAQGKWQWQASGASNWNDIASSGLVDASALYLAANTSLRFLPTSNYNGTPGGLTARLVDSSASGLTNGSANTNVSTNGGTTAYSAATVSLSTSVTAVNDAPVASGTASLASILEDNTSSTGSLVSALFGSNTNFSDVDGNTLGGVAITANTANAAQGKWQWQASGTSNWTDIASSGLADASALYLAASTSLRFLPASNFNGAPGGLTARLVDSSASGLTNGSASTNVSTNGGTTVYSAATVSLSTSVTAVNDAPVATGTASLGSTNEDNFSPSSYTVAALFNSKFSDVDSNTLGGVAVTGNSADAATQGKWQWQANAVGANWTDFSSVSDASALFLLNGTNLRFLPNANYFGTPGDLSVRLVDSTALLSNGSTINVQSNGGTTAYSSSTVAVSISVSNVDDAPTGAVSFTGTASPGNLLTASNTLADLDGMGIVTYHWQTQTASVWSDVATGITYTPTASDSGKSIRVHATYTDGGGKAESMDSGSSTVAADTTPPLLKSVSVYSNTLTLGFDETLMGPTGGADVSSFTLTTYDSGSRATTVNLTGVSVPLNVQSNAYMYDKYNIQYNSQSMLSASMPYLKLSYTDASGDDANALQDLSGNDMPSFNLIMFNGNANANATGTTGIDYIMGGGGSDIITGGKGNDVMWGLDSARSTTTSDNDTFVWLSGDEGTGAVDTIKDFTVWNGTTGDKLNLTGLLNGYNSSFTITNWIKSVTTGQVVNGVANSTVIAIDADGSGPSSYTQTINLEGVDLLNGVAGADLAAKLLALKSSGVIITA